MARNGKTKVRGKAAKQMSAIGDFIWRLKRLEEKTVMLETHHVNVGWKDEIVSNFDADFVGPGIKAASLATIAKVMNYGRTGGVAKGQLQRAMKDSNAYEANAPITIHDSLLFDLKITTPECHVVACMATKNFLDSCQSARMRDTVTSTCKTFWICVNFMQACI